MEAWPDILARRLHRVLSTRSTGLSEHELIQLLRSEGCEAVPELERRDLFGLFRVHFRLYHALYRLRDRLRSERRAELVPDPLCLRLEPWQPGADALHGHDELAAWYRDLDNLEFTSPEDVARMITERQSMARKRAMRETDLVTLGVNGDARPDDIRRRYRKLAMTHHPDRGGEAETFTKIRQAAERLLNRR